MSAFAARSVWLAMLTELRNHSAKASPVDYARNIPSAKDDSRSSVRGHTCRHHQETIVSRCQYTAKTTFLVTGGATVTASNPFIGLENESMITHCRIMGLRWCSSCSFRSLLIETAETADNARCQSLMYLPCEDFWNSLPRLFFRNSINVRSAIRSP